MPEPWEAVEGEEVEGEEAASAESSLGPAGTGGKKLLFRVGDGMGKGQQGVTSQPGPLALGWPPGLVQCSEGTYEAWPLTVQGSGPIWGPLAVLGLPHAALSVGWVCS